MGGWVVVGEPHGDYVESRLSISDLGPCPYRMQKVVHHVPQGPCWRSIEVKIGGY